MANDTGFTIDVETMDKGLKKIERAYEFLQKASSKIDQAQSSLASNISVEGFSQIKSMMSASIHDCESIINKCNNFKDKANGTINSVSSATLKPDEPTTDEIISLGQGPLNPTMIPDLVKAQMKADGKPKPDIDKNSSSYKDTKNELTSHGLVETDAERVLNGEIAVEELYNEIVNDKDRSRYRYQMEYQYLSSCSYSYKGSSDDLDKLNEEKDEIQTQLNNLKVVVDPSHGVLDPVKKGERDKLNARLKEINKAIVKLTNQMESYGEIEFTFNNMDELAKAIEIYDNRIASLMAAARYELIKVNEFDAYKKFFNELYYTGSVESALALNVAYSYTDSEGNLIYSFNLVDLYADTNSKQPDNLKLLTYQDIYGDSIATTELLQSIEGIDPNDRNEFFKHLVLTDESITENYGNYFERDYTDTSKYDEITSELATAIREKNIYISIRDNINSNIDYYFKNIDPYITKDDFAALSLFNGNYDIITGHYTIGAKDDLDCEEYIARAILYLLNDCTMNPDGTRINNSTINGKDYNAVVSNTAEYVNVAYLGKDYHYENGTSMTNYSEMIKNFAVKWRDVMTNEEIRTFTYICNTGGKDGYLKGFEYLKSIENELDKRNIQQRQAFDEEYAADNPFLASLASVFVKPIEGIGGFFYSMNCITNGVDMKRSNLYSMADVWRNTVSSTIRVLNGGFAADMYNTGMSMADSGLVITLTTLTGGGSLAFSIGVMGSSVYLTTLNSALDRNIDPKKAVVLALGAAAIESLMENYSVGHLMGLEKEFTEVLTNGTVMKKILSKLAEHGIHSDTAVKLLAFGYCMLDQAMIEGDEELWTEVLDYYWDMLIAGDLSERALAMEKYKTEHPFASNTEICMNETYRILGNVTEAWKGGALSGLFFGLGAGVRTNNALNAANRMYVNDFNRKIATLQEIMASMNIDTKTDLPKVDESNNESNITSYTNEQINEVKDNLESLKTEDDLVKSKVVDTLIPFITEQMKNGNANIFAIAEKIIKNFDKVNIEVAEEDSATTGSTITFKQVALNSATSILHEFTHFLHIMLDSINLTEVQYINGSPLIYRADINESGLVAVFNKLKGYYEFNGYNYSDIVSNARAKVSDKSNPFWAIQDQYISNSYDLAKKYAIESLMNKYNITEEAALAKYEEIVDNSMAKVKDAIGENNENIESILKRYNIDTNKYDVNMPESDYNALLRLITERYLANAGGNNSTYQKARAYLGRNSTFTRLCDIVDAVTGGELGSDLISGHSNKWEYYYSGDLYGSDLQYEYKGNTKTADASRGISNQIREAIAQFEVLLATDPNAVNLLTEIFGEDYVNMIMSEVNKINGVANINTSEIGEVKDSINSEKQNISNPSSNSPVTIFNEIFNLISDEQGNVDIQKIKQLLANDNNSDAKKYFSSKIPEFFLRGINCFNPYYNFCLDRNNINGFVDTIFQQLSNGDFSSVEKFEAAYPYLQKLADLLDSKTFDAVSEYMRMVLWENGEAILPEWKEEFEKYRDICMSIIKNNGAFIVGRTSYDLQAVEYELKTENSTLDKELLLFARKIMKFCVLERTGHIFNANTINLNKLIRLRDGVAKTLSEGGSNILQKQINDLNEEIAEEQERLKFIDNYINRYIQIVNTTIIPTIKTVISERLTIEEQESINALIDNFIKNIFSKESLQKLDRNPFTIMKGYLEAFTDLNMSFDENVNQFNNALITIGELAKTVNEFNSLENKDLFALLNIIRNNLGIVPTDKEHGELENKYRDHNIQGGAFGILKYVPDYHLVETEMNKLNEYFYELMNEKDINMFIRKAAILYYKYIVIHPYSDGNGRTGRILLNTLLASRGIVIPSLYGNEGEEHKLRTTIDKAFKASEGDDIGLWEIGGVFLHRIKKIAISNLQVIDVSGIDTERHDDGLLSHGVDPNIMNMSYKGYDVVYKTTSNVEVVIDKIVKDNKGGKVLLELNDTIGLTMENLSKLPSNVEIRVLGDYGLENLMSFKANGSALHTLENATYTVEQMRQIIQVINDFESGINKEWDDTSKAKYAYDFLNERFKYTAKTNGNANRESYFDGLTNLIYNISTCQGFAHTYRELLTRMGIKCYEISGKIIGGHSQHAFTVVNLDGKTVIIDPTRNRFNDDNYRELENPNITEERRKELELKITENNAKFSDSGFIVEKTWQYIFKSNKELKMDVDINSFKDRMGDAVKEVTPNDDGTITIKTKYDEVMVVTLNGLYSQNLEQEILNLNEKHEDAQLKTPDEILDESLNEEADIGTNATPKDVLALFNEIVESGVFGESGNVDFEKVKQAILSENSSEALKYLYARIPEFFTRSVYTLVPLYNFCVDLSQSRGENIKNIILKDLATGDFSSIKKIVELYSSFNTLARFVGTIALNNRDAKIKRNLLNGAMIIPDSMQADYQKYKEVYDAIIENDGVLFEYGDKKYSKLSELYEDITSKDISVTDKELLTFAYTIMKYCELINSDKVFDRYDSGEVDEMGLVNIEEFATNFKTQYFAIVRDELIPAIKKQVTEKLSNKITQEELDGLYTVLEIFTKNYLSEEAITSSNNNPILVMAQGFVDIKGKTSDEALKHFYNAIITLSKLPGMITTFEGMENKNLYSLVNLIRTELVAIPTDNDHGELSMDYRTFELNSRDSFFSRTARAVDINKQMERLNDEFADLMNEQDINEYIKKAGILWYKFLLVHPYADGNGRTSRLLLNVILAHRNIYIPSLYNNEKEQSDLNIRLNRYVIVQSASKVDYNALGEEFLDYIKNLDGVQINPILNKNHLNQSASGIKTANKGAMDAVSSIDQAINNSLFVQDNITSMNSALKKGLKSSEVFNTGQSTKNAITVLKSLVIEHVEPEIIKKYNTDNGFDFAGFLNCILRGSYLTDTDIEELKKLDGYKQIIDNPNEQLSLIENTLEDINEMINEGGIQSLTEKHMELYNYYSFLAYLVSRDYDFRINNIEILQSIAGKLANIGTGILKSKERDTIDYRGVKIKLYGDDDQFLGESLRRTMEAIEQLPEPFLKLFSKLNGFEIYDDVDPNDLRSLFLYKKICNDPNRTAFTATGMFSFIKNVIWLNRRTAYYDFLEILCHELGHFLDGYIWQMLNGYNGYNGTITSSGIWQKAVDQDARSVSPYGDVDIGEDFAELCLKYSDVAFGLDPDIIRAYYPARFNILEKLFLLLEDPANIPFAKRLEILELFEETPYTNITKRLLGDDVISNFKEHTPDQKLLITKGMQKSGVGNSFAMYFFAYDHTSIGDFNEDQLLLLYDMYASTTIANEIMDSIFTASNCTPDTKIKIAEKMIAYGKTNELSKYILINDDFLDGFSKEQLIRFFDVCHSDCMISFEILKKISTVAKGINTNAINELKLLDVNDTEKEFISYELPFKIEYTNAEQEFRVWWFDDVRDETYREIMRIIFKNLV